MRYQEARHVGDALTRDALRQLATTIDAPPSSTIVVNSTARPRAGLVEVPLPGTGPVHLVAVDDGTACPTQVVRTIEGEGVSTVVVGQKIRWVLEMMRGPELAGARIARVEDRTLRRRQSRVHVPRRRSRGDRTRPRSDQGDPAGVRRGGCHHRHPSAPRAGARGRRGRRSRARLRLAHVPRGRGFRTRYRGARRGVHPGQRAPAGQGRSRRRHRHHRGRRPHAGRASTATSTAATVATPTTTHHPTVDTVVDRPESVRVHVDEVGPGASENRRHRLLPVALARRR